jgi:hypothetical protein
MAHDWPEVPAVCFDDDICRLLHMSRRTLKRRRHTRTFPIPELPSLDRRRRYGRADVVAFLERRTVAGKRG